MHIILGLVGIATAVYFLVIRARNAAEMTHEVMDVASDVRAAARRLGYRFRNNVHPVDAVEDPKVLASTIVLGFLDLDDFPTREQRDAMTRQAQSVYDIPLAEAEELGVLARWLINQCGDTDAAITRSARALFKMGDPGAAQNLLSYLNGTMAAGGGLSDKQREALADVQRALRL